MAASFSKTMQNLMNVVPINLLHILKIVANGLKQTAKIQDDHKMQFTTFKGHLDTLYGATKHAAREREDNPCIWVAAALRKVEREDTLELSYGGVILAPEVKSGTLPKCSDNISVVLTGERIRNGTSYKPYYTAPWCLPANSSASKRDAMPTTMAHSSRGSRSKPPDNTTWTNAGGDGGIKPTSLGDVKPTTSGGGRSGSVKPIASEGGGSSWGGAGSGGGDGSGGRDGSGGGDGPGGGDPSEGGNSRRASVDQGGANDTQDTLHTRVGCDTHTCSGSLHPNLKRDGNLLTAAQEVIQQLVLTEDERVSITENMISAELERPRHHPRCKSCLCMKNTEHDFIICTATGEILRKNVNVDKHKCPCQVSSVVYLATCKFTGKQYVGTTKNRLQDRITGHRNDSKSSLYRHWKGHYDRLDFHEVFDFEILVQTQPEMLRPVEKLLIVRFCSKGEGLNRRL